MSVIKIMPNHILGDISRDLTKHNAITEVTCKYSNVNYGVHTIKKISFNYDNSITPIVPTNSPYAGFPYDYKGIYEPSSSGKYYYPSRKNTPSSDCLSLVKTIPLQYRKSGVVTNTIEEYSIYKGRITLDDGNFTAIESVLATDNFADLGIKQYKVTPDTDSSFGIRGTITNYNSLQSINDNGNTQQYSSINGLDCVKLFDNAQDIETVIDTLINNSINNQYAMGNGFTLFGLVPYNAKVGVLIAKDTITSNEMDIWVICNNWEWNLQIGSNLNTTFVTSIELYSTKSVLTVENTSDIKTTETKVSANTIELSTNEWMTNLTTIDGTPIVEHISNTILDKYAKGLQVITLTVKYAEYRDISDNIVYTGKDGRTLNVGDIVEIYVKSGAQIKPIAVSYQETRSVPRRYKVLSSEINYDKGLSITITVLEE